MNNPINIEFMPDLNPLYGSSESAPDETTYIVDGADNVVDGIDNIVDGEAT